MSNKSNTVAKGNAFEDRVFAKFKELLETGELPISKYSRIYQKKSYTGKSGSDIVFDISIESYMPNTKEYSLLILVECKDYNRSIQVEKLRDFSSRIEDVSAHKGFFITSSKFQKGALDWAKSKGIGLALLDNTDKESWILRRIGKQKYQIKQEIEDYFIKENSFNSFPFVALSGYNYFTSIVDFLSDAVGYDLPLPFKIDYLSQENIEEIICSLFSKKSRNTHNYYLEIEELISFIKKQNYSLNFGSELLEQLGYCDFQNKNISITNSLEYDSPRWRFTFAHEVGHFILHRYLFENNNIMLINDDENTINMSEGLTKRLEMQANMFAANLLVPNKICFEKYILLHKRLGLRNFPFLYIDHQPVNKYIYHQITGELANCFRVSKEVIKNKLLSLNLLTIENSS
jgi:Zn-dependent peptidase ImmA (M78 family)